MSVISPAFADRYDMLPRGQTVICAVSGGADSVCLLHWLCALAGERELRLYAAHFDHGIRGEESARDAGFVARLCEELSIPLITRRGDAAAFARANHLGTEEAARRLRYAFFASAAAELPGSRVATAHTAGDNAETLLMNLARGAALRGLGGIPPVRGVYIRPFLQTDRAEILRYLEERGLSWVEDSTNGGDDYTRNRLRHHVLPLLKQEYPALLKKTAACMDSLREDEAYLTAEAARLLPWEESETGELIISAAKLSAAPRPLSLRALRAGAEALGLRLSGERLEALLSLAGKGGPSAQADLPGGGKARREYDRFILSPSGCQQPPFEALPLVWGAWTALPGTGYAFFYGDAAKKDLEGRKFYFKKAELCGILTVRPRRTGDHVLLDRSQGGKTLKKWMIEKKIPLGQRDRVPVLADEKGVLALIPYGPNLERTDEADSDCFVAVKYIKKV